MSSKVLLLYTNESLGQVFENALRDSGYNVFPFIIHPLDYFAFTPKERLINIFKRIVLKDKSYFKVMQMNVRHRYYKKRIQVLQQSNARFDYCLAVHAGFFPDYVLAFAREISGKMIDYQPDGISSNDSIVSKAGYFDQIFAFDENDIDRYPELDLKPATNFHLGRETPQENDQDLFYIGALLPERKNILENLYDHLPQFTTKFMLGINHWEAHRIEHGIEYINQSLSYYENLTIVKRSKVLLDLKRAEHDGLSFRFFEALAYQKKVITNNPTVRNYPFYHPDNIHITQDFTDYETMIAFIHRPYHAIPNEIVDAYNFKNWVTRLFDA